MKVSKITNNRKQTVKIKKHQKPDKQQKLQIKGQETKFIKKLKPPNLSNNHLE